MQTSSKSPALRYLVTGSSGFVGSKIVDTLLSEGHEVIGVDAELDHLYPSEVKSQRRTYLLTEHNNFQFFKEDLRTFDVSPLLEGVAVVIHEAAMPGLGLSWKEFALYESCNVMAMSRLLEAIRQYPNIHLVHASTSSVYGEEATGTEEAALEPVSPYGVTKLAAEHLIRAYERNFSLSATILRYFSLFGPSQRPDMAYARFTDQLLKGEVISIFGDGKQTRSNTYISDAVSATLLASQKRLGGQTFNICGDETISLLDAVAELSNTLQVKPKLEFLPRAHGDQRRTAGNNSKAKLMLGWSPSMPIRQGLQVQAQHAAANLGDY